jgi:small-conductance mechanosensitive channel
MGKRPAWRIVRTAIVRLRPMILMVAIAIFVLPILGYPFFGSFLESIALGGVLIAAGATFAHRAVMELWQQYSPRLTVGEPGSAIANARRTLLNQVVHWVSLALFTGAAYFAFVAILHVGEDELSSVDIGVVAGRRLSVLDILRGVAVLAAGLVLANWTRRTLDLFILPLTTLDVGTRYAVALTASYFVILFGLGAASLQLGLQFGDLAILLGAAGFAIGLGMQQAAANFLSGLVLLFSRPIKVGDVIESESRIGTVTHINIASTVIVTPDNHEIRIPNGDIIGKRLVNQSGRDPKVRAACKVSVSYDTDLDKARAVILNAVKNVKGVFEKPEPQVVVVTLGESSIDFEARIWVSAALSEREQTTTNARKAIFTALVTAGIQIPYPQYDLHIKDPVELRGGGEKK